MSFGYYALLFGASFVGIVAGHSLVRAIIGGGPAPAHYDHHPSAPPAPCSSEAQQLGQCIDFASQDISKCQVYMDLLVSCQQRSH
jgi:hypothetical protein